MPGYTFEIHSVENKEEIDNVMEDVMDVIKENFHIANNPVQWGRVITWTETDYPSPIADAIQDIVRGYQGLQAIMYCEFDGPQDWIEYIKGDRSIAFNERRSWPKVDQIHFDNLGWKHKNHEGAPYLDGIPRIVQKYILNIPLNVLEEITKDTKRLDISLSINGVSVNAIEVLQSILDGYQDDVEHEARRIARETIKNLDAITTTLKDIIENVEMLSDDLADIVNENEDLLDE